MSGRVVTITGGSGFVGHILRRGLSERGYKVDVFDRLRGPLVEVLRRRYLGTSASRGARLAARGMRTIQRRLERVVIGTGVLRPTGEDILDFRSRVAARFGGSYAVVHLAGIAHPNAPGTVDDDFRRINYEGAINVYEAAREAGVAKFVFASSAQVYRINAPIQVDQLPILESNYCPGLEDGQSTYGFLKLEMERYLARAAADRPGPTQAISLRLEYPGFQSGSPRNQYISTSVENLVAGFVCALGAPDGFGADVFNLCDAHVDRGIVDIQAFIRSRWPGVPNHTNGNQSLLSTAKAATVLGYRPTPGGTYFDPWVVW